MTTVLAIDPSSTRTGFAVMRTTAKRGQYALLDCGLFVPTKRYSSAAIRINDMVADMCLMLPRLIEQHVADGGHMLDFLVGIEVPSGRPGRAVAAGAKAQLAIYGRAVGEFVRAAKCAQSIVCEVDERTWTRRRTRQQRQMEARAYPLYRLQVELDRGYDISDAIGVGEWVLGLIEARSEHETRETAR